MPVTAFAWLRELFARPSRASRARGYDPSTFEFPPIEIDKAARQLGLREKAASNGTSELPPSGSSQLDGPQQAVVQFVKGEVAYITTAFETKIAGLNSQITRRDVRQLVNEVSNIDQDLDHGLQAIRDDLLLRASEAGDALEAVERDYTVFRSDNALDRDPEYPQSHFLHVAVIVAVVVGEAVLNAIFFERGNPHGLVGGAVWALILAMIDVGLVFPLGLVSVWVTTRSTVHRIAGALALTVFAVWVSFYNLLVAHIREALSADPDRFMQLAWTTFRQGPLGLSQADSWILLAVGIMFSTGAMADGFTWTDRFPGYAKRDGRLRLARQQVQHYQSELVRRTTEARDLALQNLGHALTNGKNSLVAMQNDIDAKRLLLTNARTFVQHQEDTCNALIAVYHDENQKARTTPPPKYFNRKWDLPMPQTFTDDTEDDVTRLEECRKALSGLEERADGLKRSIRERYVAFRTRHTPGYADAQ